MSNREKVILILAVVAILYGGYNFIFSKKNTKNIPQKTVDIQKIQKETINTLAKYSLSKSDKIVEGLMKNDTKDPFTYKKVEKDIKKKEDTKITNLTYNGYVMLNNKKVAIINNKEYQEGDELDIKSYFVEQIFENKVVIKGPGKDNFITVPLIDLLKIHKKVD